MPMEFLPLCWFCCSIRFRLGHSSGAYFCCVCFHYLRFAICFRKSCLANSPTNLALLLLDLFESPSFYSLRSQVLSKHYLAARLRLPGARCSTTLHSQAFCRHSAGCPGAQCWLPGSMLEVAREHNMYHYLRFCSIIEAF